MAHISQTGPGADPHTDHGLESVAVHHEVTDIPLAGLTRAAVISIAFIAIVMLLMWGVWGFFLNQMHSVDPGKPAMAADDYGQRLPATPRLQSVPTDDLTAYRKEQAAKLNGLAWVDQSAGTVRMPIGAAMRLIVTRADAFADPHAKAPAEHSWAHPGAQAAPAAATGAPATAAPAGAHGSEHAPAAPPPAAPHAPAPPQH
jgi:hypothetical protein